MSVLLLANVGLRDLLLDGQRIEPARTEGETIKSQFDACAPRLTLPMLSPVLAHLLREHGALHVVLYGTDQPEGTPPEHRSRDTFPLAEVAARLLKLKPGQRIPKAVARPINANPSLYDDMLSFFRDQLSAGGAGWMKDVEVCYVSLMGGTPAANTGLMLAAIERFAERCRTVYLPEGDTRPIRMDVGEQIRRNELRRLAAERLQDRSFGGAAALLEKAGAPSWMVGVARHASDRYHFDFESAAVRLDGAIRDCAEDWNGRARCRALSQNLSGLRDQQPVALIRETHHNAAMAYRRGEYAAFLGLVFRFQEAVLMYIVEQMYPGLPADTTDNVSKRRYQEYLQSRPDLNSFLERQKVDNRPLKFGEPNRPVLGAIARFGWEEPDGSIDPSRLGRFQSACALLDRLDCLSRLRNRSAIAHGFEGVSDARLRDKYAGAGNATTPLEDMAATLAALGIDVGKSPFEDSAALLLEELAKL